jgi:hypothetical protein
MHTPDSARRSSAPSRVRLSRRSFMKTAAIGGGVLALGKLGAGRALAAGPNNTGPTYVLPSTGGVTLTPILTTGDAADNGYRMVGIPDGLGAFGEEHTFTLLMNHELTASAGSSGPGLVRAHGSSGAFVSRWTIDRKSLRVLAGEDLTRSPSDVFTWDATHQIYVPGTTAWDRLCSADLPDEKALRHGNRGTRERIFFDGEEVTTGRPWARIVTGPNAGQAWQLPRLGRMAYENVVACPHGKDRTIVALFDDGSLSTAPIAASNPSEVYVYVGTKQQDGSEIERAGLTNGKLYGVRVFRGHTLVTEESDAFGLGDAGTGYVDSGRFELVELGTAGDVSALSALQLEQDAIAKNVFRLQRPEDGAWDPRGGGKEDLYFVTTASISPLRNSRLWRLSFDDLDRPERGGEVEILLTNTPGRMFDNITIDRLGRLLLQEDTGDNPWVAKIWLYGIDDESLIEIAHHDPAFFEPGGPAFITQDEESSGIIDAHDVLGEGWFLFDVQVHRTSLDPELVQGGQLLAMHVHPHIGR